MIISEIIVGRRRAYIKDGAACKLMPTQVQRDSLIAVIVSAANEHHLTKRGIRQQADSRAVRRLIQRGSKVGAVGETAICCLHPYHYLQITGGAVPALTVGTPCHLMRALIAADHTFTVLIAQRMNAFLVALGALTVGAPYMVAGTGAYGKQLTIAAVVGILST